MKKHLPILLLFLVIGILIFTRPNEIDLSPFEKKIDSLELVATDQRQIIKGLEMQAQELEVSEDLHAKKVDSLSRELLKPHACPDQVRLLELKIDHLELGWQKCREAKGIYIQAANGLKDLNATMEVITVTKEEVCNAKVKNLKKEKRKSFLWGMGAGGAIVLLLILL